MPWQWWAVLVTAVLGAVILVGGSTYSRWRMAREERSQGVVGASDEWADTLHGIRVHTAKEAELEDTGAIDMTWLRLHLDFEDIETTLHNGLTVLTDSFTAILLDDARWEAWTWDDASSDVFV